jgi:hypothetical protein
MWKSMALVTRSCDLAISVELSENVVVLRSISLSLFNETSCNQSIYRESKMAERIEKLTASAEQDTSNVVSLTPKELRAELEENLSDIQSSGGMAPDRHIL